MEKLETGVLLATNKRVVFYGKKLFGYYLEVFPYSNISSIELNKEMNVHFLKLFASGNEVKIKSVSKNVLEFVNEVKGRIDKKESGSSTTLSNADELKKFAELKDAGIISEEEFNVKKKQILGI